MVYEYILMPLNFILNKYYNTILNIFKVFQNDLIYFSSRGEEDLFGIFILWDDNTYSSKDLT